MWSLGGRGRWGGGGLKGGACRTNKVEVGHEKVCVCGGGGVLMPVPYRYLMDKSLLKTLFFNVHLADLL